LSASRRMLDDQDVVQQILKDELDYMSGEGKQIAIAERYQLDHDEEVIVKSTWRRLPDTGQKFPITGIIGKTTEVGFRNMIRAAVLGVAENIHARKGNGQWVLDSYKVRKGYDGDTKVRVIKGKVSRNHDIGQDYGDHIMDEGTDGAFIPMGYAPSELVQEAVERSVLYMDFVFVDIAGDEEIIFENGRPAGEARREAKETATAMNQLAIALQALLAGQAPPKVANQTPDPDDALEILAKKYGLRVSDIIGAVRKAQEVQAEPEVAMEDLSDALVEEEEAPADTNFEPITDGVPNHGAAIKDAAGEWKWRCGLCGHKTRWHALGVRQHMNVHLRNMECSVEDVDREVDWVKAGEPVQS